MNIYSNEGRELDAQVSISSIDNMHGLILESRSGKNKNNCARNTDYFEALEIILRRLQILSVKVIRISLVSKRALNFFTKEKRALQYDGSSDINLKNCDVVVLRKWICNEISKIKENDNSKGGCPTKRIIINADIEEIKWNYVITGVSGSICLHERDLTSESDLISECNYFDLSKIKNYKDKVSRVIVLRRGQSEFRKKLLLAYNNKCTITGTCVVNVLEAAHIYPYFGECTNKTSNGLLLRADIHTLFDLGLINIDEFYNVNVSHELKDSEYYIYNGAKLSLPKNECDHPNIEAIKFRLSQL